VAIQRDDPSSTLNRVRRLIRLRRETPALRPTASTEVLAAEYPLVYLRGGSHLVVINPSSKTVTADIPALSDRAFTGLEVNGVKLKGSVVHAGPFGYAVFSTAG
jgi:glycosidase